MDCTVSHLSYRQTGYFSRIIADYIERDHGLKPFYEHEVSMEGITRSIVARKKFSTNRQVVASYLRKQYQNTNYLKVIEHIDSLEEENTFTVCTAHQPVIFTGTLYFIYKILHVIKLADHLTKKMPANKFVPVFYMGCEDADLNELGTFHLEGEAISWDTKQKGAVGRMKPIGLEKIINRIEGELSIHPFGTDLISLLRKCYLGAKDIQSATFTLLNELFGTYGLIVLIPDAAELKQLMIPVFEDDLFRQSPSDIVEKTTMDLREYKVQANPREINLFYLEKDIRNRIARQGEKWMVVDTTLSFTEDELKKELQQHPERFSPNVILRGVFQETILPNIVFIGGGGELAYWLELKSLFNHFSVPYPVLILRNSFLLIEQKWKEKMQQLAIEEPRIFEPENDLLAELVKNESTAQLTLHEEITNANGYYDHLKEVASKVDRSLEQHVSALQAKAVKPIQMLEKKLLKAEKRKFEAQQRQLSAIKAELFPNESLQERVGNFMPFYSRYGPDFFKLIWENSLLLEQEFTVVTFNR